MQNLIEKIFYRFQFWWMKKRRTREVITPYFIAFHPSDVRQKILALFGQKMKEYKS